MLDFKSARNALYGC